MQQVQTFGKKKTSIATCIAMHGKGVVLLNGRPLELMQPEILRFKLLEPLLLLGTDRFKDIDIKVHVTGGGSTSRIYAARQAISKAIIAYYQKFVDEATKREIRDILIAYDRNLLVADPRRCEPKKFGGPGARARYQKSYR